MNTDPCRAGRHSLNYLSFIYWFTHKIKSPQTQGFKGSLIIPYLMFSWNGQAWLNKTCINIKRILFLWSYKAPRTVNSIIQAVHFIFFKWHSRKMIYLIISWHSVHHFLWLPENPHSLDTNNFQTKNIISKIISSSYDSLHVSLKCLALRWYHNYFNS